MKKTPIVLLALTLINSNAFAATQPLTTGEYQLSLLLNGKMLVCSDLGNSKGEKDEVLNYQIKESNGAIVSEVNDLPTDSNTGVVIYQGTYVDGNDIVISFEDNARPPEPLHNLMLNQNQLAQLADGRVATIAGLLQYHDTGLNGYNYAYYSVACRMYY